MKTRIITIICALAAIVPQLTSAQANIQKAFDKLLKNSDVKYAQSHSIDKDTKTGKKESQCDVYIFTLPVKKKALLEDVVKAFKADEKDAYASSFGALGSNSMPITLAVGDGSTSGINVANPGDEFIYACFLAPASEDPEGIYRYAYAMSGTEKGDTATIKLVVTYATTLKHRQEAASANPYKGMQLNTLSPTISTDSWFSTFIAYVQAMSKGSTAAKQVIAAKLYEHSKQARTSTEISKEDKDTAREILKGLISETDGTDKITMKLLNSTLGNLR